MRDVDNALRPSCRHARFSPFYPVLLERHKVEDCLARATTLFAEVSPVLRVTEIVL